MQSATRLRLRLRHRPLAPSIPVFAAFAAPVHHRKGENPCPIRHVRSEEHTSELQSPCNLVCRLLLEKKKRERLVLRTRISRLLARDLRTERHRLARDPPLRHA